MTARVVRLGVAVPSDEIIDDQAFNFADSPRAPLVAVKAHGLRDNCSFQLIGWCQARFVRRRQEVAARERPLPRSAFSLEVPGWIGALGKPLQRARIPLGLGHDQGEVILHDDQ